MQPKPTINLTPLIGIALILIVLVMVTPVPGKLEVAIPPISSMFDDLMEADVWTQEERLKGLPIPVNVEEPPQPVRKRTKRR